MLLINEKTIFLCVSKCKQAPGVSVVLRVWGVQGEPKNIKGVGNVEGVRSRGSLMKIVGVHYVCLTSRNQLYKNINEHSFLRVFYN